ncbi:MAG: BMP family ABC transporter substrate-binding protein [Lachnospiraceae bacterium]|nr:BMP family ABC transporter substrate-binding protein [Lachnospiraceae bacterium]
MLEDYIKAKKRGDREWHRAAAEGRYPYLPALDEMVESIESLNTHPVGLVEIPIDMIVGTRSKGRTNAFSWGYMPILREKSEFAQKWSRLYDIQAEEGIRDAIKVYEYMQRFYVEEGNKRVSVLKYLGVPTILGDVTRIEPMESDNLQYRIYREFEEFYRVAPLYELTFSKEGGYRKLAGYFGQNLEEPWGEEALESMRSAFQYFRQAYIKRGGDNLPITPGDALLIYLEVYGADDAATVSTDKLRERINKIWPEFLAKTEADHIELLEEPDRDEEKDPKPQGLLGGLLKKQPSYSREHPLRAAFLYDKSPEESAWTYGHELGRNYVEQAFDGVVETMRYDSCGTDEEMEKAIEAVLSDGDEVVFTVAPSQLPHALRTAIAHPEIRFLNCSVNTASDAVRSYYGRMYEAKFLMGALAASVSDNHRIGYLAKAPVYGELADINAFAIGAGLVDPKARIYLTWSATEEDWRRKMAEEGIRVQSASDLIRPAFEGRMYGLFMTQDDGTIQNLAMPVRNWGRYYELILRSILNGKWDEKKGAAGNRSLNYWYGMSSGVIDVIVSDKISYYSRKLVGILKQAVIAGTLSPFDGEMRSLDGIIKREEDERLSPESIIRMNYLNDNIIGSIPVIEEFPDKVDRESVKISGVLGS